MAEIVLFHHALGLTPGCLAFAGDLRAAGHRVHVPDLYDGKVFADLKEGLGYAEAVGFNRILADGRRAVEALPQDLVYTGFSLGVMPAQMLAQTRPGARAALFFHACVPPAEFGGPWPEGVPLQIHTMEDDAWGDVDVARGLAESSESVELFLYPGDRHLFTDNSLPDFDESAAALLKRRVLAFLNGLA